MTPQQWRLRTRSRGAAGNSYASLKASALTAATANSASLWFLGNAADLTGNVFSDSAGTIQATTGSAIGYVKDRNGNAFPASTTGTAPTVVQLANGYFVMNFASSGAMPLFTNRTFTNTTSDRTVIAKAESYSPGNVRTFYASSPRAPQVRINPDNSALILYQPSGGPTGIGGPAIAPSAPSVVRLIESAGTATLYVAGTSVNSTAIPSTADTFGAQAAIGAQVGGLEYFIGNIALICVSSNAMSNTDCLAIETFANFLVI